MAVTKNKRISRDASKMTVHCRRQHTLTARRQAAVA